MLVCTAAPFWAEKPTSQDVVENDKVTFRCRGDGIPEPRIQWLINGVPLTRTFALRIHAVSKKRQCFGLQ